MGQRLARASAVVAVGVFCLGSTFVQATGPPRLFGHYSGQADVSTSPFYPPGVYDAEVLVAQTASGVVGYVNIVFDAADFLGGTLTYVFSARLSGSSNVITLSYSDRKCGAGDPIGKCYPHSQTQYSFDGAAVFVVGTLTLLTPSIRPDLPYVATLPFDSIQLTRTQSELRSSFEGVYDNLDYPWMGTVLLPLPLPLAGNNEVVIQNGAITQWTGNGGVPVSVPGIVSVSCFDDSRGQGWMNQQGFWFYYWVLAPDGQGVSVIVTFDTQAPDCADLQDPLAGDNLDVVHGDLVGVMFERSAPVSGPGVVSGLQVAKSSGMLDLTWEGDCGSGVKYGVYRGDVAAGYDSLAPELCNAMGSGATLPEGSGTADFFVVVPNRGQGEGSYGLDSHNVRRPPAASACFAQTAVDSCAP